jgi:hypothetical protein
VYSIQVSIYGPIAVRDRHVRSLLDATILMDMIEFDTKPFPWLADAQRAGLRYATTACTEDVCSDVPWEDPWTILARGWTDCKNLVKWRIVELRKRKGMQVGYKLRHTTSPSGDVIFHPTVVGYSGGREIEEDTSLVLGMGQPGSIIL